MNGEFIRLIVGTAGKEALRHHIERATGQSLPDEDLEREWLDLTKPGGPDLEPDPNAHLRTLMELWPGFSAYLAESHWTVIRLKRPALVTSDHPVTMAVGADYPKFYGVGIATADLFSLPITRSIGLNIQPRRRLLEYTENVDQVPDFDVKGTDEFADSMNQQTVGQARRYVYRHPDDDISTRVRLPEPTERSRMDTRGIDGLIAEDGLFAGATGPLPKPLRASDEDEGVSLDDLPWPIPRRRSVG